MPNYELVISSVAVPSKKRRKLPPKSREFAVPLVAYVRADAWWSGGITAISMVRPIWMLLAGTEAAMRAVVANLRLGRRAEIRPHTDTLHWEAPPNQQVELLRSAQYTFPTVRVTGDKSGTTVCTTAMLPQLQSIHPGMIDPAMLGFVALAPQWWLTQQEVQLRADPALCQAVQTHAQRLGLYQQPRGVGAPPWTAAEVLGLLANAIYCTTFIERRTTRPLVADPAFLLQIFLAGLQQGILSVPRIDTLRGQAGTPPDDGWEWARHPDHSSFRAFNLPPAGIPMPIACLCAQAEMDRFLAGEVERYFAARP